MYLNSLEYYSFPHLVVTDSERKNISKYSCLCKRHAAHNSIHSENRPTIANPGERARSDLYYQKELGMNLCFECSSKGYCKKLKTYIVKVDELTGEFMQDMKRHMRVLSFKHKLTPGMWFDFVTDAYRDYMGTMVNAEGEENFLDTEVFAEFDPRDFFRNLLRLDLEAGSRRPRPETHSRLIVLASILKAHSPSETAYWGLRAANDN